MKKIVTDYINLDKAVVISSESVEKALQERYNELLRWAIVSVAENDVKVCVTYEK